MIVLRLALVAAVMLCCSQAQAYLPAPTSPYTVTFDDIPSGSGLDRYDELYGLRFVVNWTVVDHSESDWGPPRSGTNVAMWDSDLNYIAGFRFGSESQDYPGTRFLPYTVRSVGLHISTQFGTVVEVLGYNSGAIPVASVLVGGTDESWNNRYVEITSSAGEIAYVNFRGVNSLAEKRQFCIDDLAITPVPEPSSLLALGAGGVGMLGAALRRRVRART